MHSHFRIAPIVAVALFFAVTVNGSSQRSTTTPPRAADLQNENDKAFALIKALDAAQRSQAILPYRVADLVLGASVRTVGRSNRKASARLRSRRRNRP